MPRKKKTEEATEEKPSKSKRTGLANEEEDKVETEDEKKKEAVEEAKPKRTRKKKETAEKTEEEKAEDEKKAKLKKALEEKAKELEAKIDKKPEEKGMKEEVAESEKKRRRSQKTLFPLDDYVKYSAHLGTKAITPHMRPFVYKRRADGLAVLNTNSIDEKLKEAAEFLKDFKPEDIFLACKREAGWKAAKKFSEVTGIKVFTKKYPAGAITNIQLEDFFEVDLIIICDPWLDKNALNDATKVKRPIIGLCDTNNLTTGITKVVPCNNKSSKSIGLILYLLAREYLIARKQEKEAEKLKLEDFTGVEESELDEREEKRAAEKSRFARRSVKEKEEKTEGAKEEATEEKKEEKTEEFEKGAKEGV
ncbi:hypothetical protein A3K73_07485 [Candidatus Pacearchaeota archaeon RBG_13_36_9]|nr:MAG: hypothetical protein A3K73_07485 [Candidatus Pacearchaeota archaeon RBG_13_36_9]